MRGRIAPLLSFTKSKWNGFKMHHILESLSMTGFQQSEGRGSSFGVMSIT